MSYTSLHVHTDYSNIRIGVVELREVVPLRVVATFCLALTLEVFTSSIVFSNSFC